MSKPENLFYKRPIINSPYAAPAQHWELDKDGQPTQKLLSFRRPAQFVTPVPLPKKRKAQLAQREIVYDEGRGLSTAAQQYETASIINEVRSHVASWRDLPSPAQWQVTPETARLLQHWRHHAFSSVRPFFCQVEALETAIWLTEVAPQDRRGKKFVDHLARAASDANPGLPRLALKLATGAGKTTVIAMLIAWQTVNAVRYPGSKRFTRGFLVVAPGITIKDRLQVLLPSDLESYYQRRELLPPEMLADVKKASILITNYHAFIRREKMEISKGGRSLLQGRGPEIATLESEGQMLQRVMSGLMAMKNILVLDDEGHHCYREKPKAPEEDETAPELKGDDRKEAEKNNEAARVWISGLETVARKIGVSRVIDLSATPFKLVYDYIAGVRRDGEGGFLHLGDLPLFRNFDEHGNPLPRRKTILIDSEQLDSGEALDKDFRALAEDEIEQFRRELMAREGDRRKADNLTDQDLLREVMNTVGRPGKLGEQIRCVVSVSMLTEGWDANTVTHVLGVRAFGTQLLCEQVIGRALRRRSYDLNDDDRFSVEYADVFGIPFDFTAEPVIPEPQKPRKLTHICAVSPERDALEIRFPRIVGYRVDLPRDRLNALFTPDSYLDLTPDLVGATEVQTAGIIGETAEMTVEHLREVRESRLVYALAGHLVRNKWRGLDGQPQFQLFGDLKRIARRWLEEGHLRCSGGTFRGQLLFPPITAIACERIAAAIERTHAGTKRIMADSDPNNPGTGTTSDVSITTSKTLLWKTDPRLCHVNFAVLDSDWEGEFCRVVEKHPRVRAYVKNHGLGFEVPYRAGSVARRYRPDFIVRLDDQHPDGDLLNLVVEIKGYRGEDAKEKRDAMDSYWVPAVNNAKEYGRWAFVELTEVFKIGSDFEARVRQAVNAGIEEVVMRRVKQAMGER